MEVHNLYAFSNLLNKLFAYLGNSQLSQEELVQQTIRSLRKHKGCGDLFLHVTHVDQEKVRLCIDGNIVFTISHACTDLPKISKEWPISISSCSATNSSLILKINRAEAFKTGLLNVISQGREYGRFQRSSQDYLQIRCNIASENQISDISETRVVLGAKVVRNLLQACGYQVEINPPATSKKQPVRDFFFTHKSTDDGMPPGSSPITCGVVLNAETGCKENLQTASKYYRQWEDTISRVSQERDNGEPREVQTEINAHIARAAVLIDLLGVKLSSCVSLKLPTLENQCYGVSSKGAPFILYNTARLASIMSQFARKVDSSYYPELPPFDDIDMSLLIYEEEWSLLFNFIMAYPFIVKKSLIGLNEGKPNVHIFVAYINAFCKEISVYYRRVRILTEPRSQLLPSMFARLYLLQSVQQVLHNALDILGIKPLLHM